MSYQGESFETKSQRGGRLQDDSRAYRDEVEEEPTDLDAPASDGLDDDELEDVEISAEELDDEGGEDDDEEAASPLAEDAPIGEAEEEEEDQDGAGTAETEEQEELELDQEVGVRHNGRREVSVMSHGERRREFPAHKAAAEKPAKAGRRARRKKVARA